MKENSDPEDGVAGAWGQVPIWLQISLRAGHPTAPSLGWGGGGCSRERRDANSEDCLLFHTL